MPGNGIVAILGIFPVLTDALLVWDDFPTSLKEKYPFLRKCFDLGTALAVLDIYKAYFTDIVAVAMNAAWFLCSIILTEGPVRIAERRMIVPGLCKGNALNLAHIANGE